jgi:hypothetical protein
MPKSPVNINTARPNVTIPPGSRLGFPGALLFIAGSALVYWVLAQWDEKHQLFGGRIRKPASQGDTT